MDVRFESPDREGASYAAHAIRQVRRALRGFHAAVRRVEVRLEDDNGPDEGGIDKRCRMSVELAGGRAAGIEARSRGWQDAVDAAVGRIRERVRGRGRESGRTRAAASNRRPHRPARAPRRSPQPA